MSDDMLAWLSVWCEAQMIYIWSSWCHCHPIISCFIKIQIGLTFLVMAYQGCPGKEAVKRVCLSLYLNSITPYERQKSYNHHHNHFTAHILAPSGWAGGRRETSELYGARED